MSHYAISSSMVLLDQKIPLPCLAAEVPLPNVSVEPIDLEAGPGAELSLVLGLVCVCPPEEACFQGFVTLVTSSEPSRQNSSARRRKRTRAAPSHPSHLRYK